MSLCGNASWPVYQQVARRGQERHRFWRSTYEVEIRAQMVGLQISAQKDVERADDAQHRGDDSRLAGRLLRGQGLESRAGEGPNGRESGTAVSPKDARRQKPEQLGLPLGGRGEAPRVQRSGEASTLTRRDRRCRKCFSKRYGSAARASKAKVKK